MNITLQAAGAGDGLAGIRQTLLRTAIQYASNPADAEDFVQNALARCWERRSTLADTNIGAWMKTVIRNLAIDESRRSIRLCRGADDPLSVREHERASPLPWDGIELEQVKEAARRCSPPLGTTFAMFYFERLSLREIADRCDVPVRTVGTRLHRARRAIRKALEHLLVPADA